MSTKISFFPRSRRNDPTTPPPPSLINEPDHANRPISSHALARCSHPKARELLPEELASKLQALPLGIVTAFGHSLLHVAVARPLNPETVAALRFATSLEIKAIEVPGEILQDAIFTAYRGDDALLQQAVEAASNAIATTSDLGLGKPAVIPFRPTEEGIGKFLAVLIDYALSRGATDLHLVPTEQGTVVKLRLNGELLEHDAPVCTPAAHRQLMTRLKVLADLDPTIHTRPHDGSLRIPTNSRRVHARVSIMPTVHGERAVLRFIGHRSVTKLAELGLPQDVAEQIARVTAKGEGGILFAGPTGSGKTTSMYAVLDHLSNHGLQLVTIEDPVEVHLERVSQTQLDIAHGLDYPAALRSALRQDPDVIMLGELRDSASASIALQAAITGHLVLSTIHARSVAESPLRLHHFGVDHATTAAALELLISQRLLPRLCHRCRIIQLDASRRFGGDVYQGGSGCAACDHSGFSGFILACESLLVTDETRALLARPHTLADFQAHLDNTRAYHARTTDLLASLKRGELSLLHFERESQGTTS